MRSLGSRRCTQRVAWMALASGSYAASVCTLSLYTSSDALEPCALVTFLLWRPTWRRPCVQAVWLTHGLLLLYARRRWALFHRSSCRPIPNK